MNPSAEYVICPCCATAYSRIDEPAEWQRVSNFNPAKYAARILGERNRGHKKHLTDAQRAQKARQLAINRSKHQKEGTV